MATVGVKGLNATKWARQFNITTHTQTTSLVSN